MSQHGNGSWETNPPGRQTGKGPTVSPVLGLTHRHSRPGLRLPGVGGMQNRERLPGRLSAPAEWEKEWAYARAGS